MEAALTVRMSVRPPAKFTEKTDWSLWISRFERYVKEAKVPDSERVKELLPLLEDEPLRLVVQYGLSESADYAAVHECLQCRYGHDGTELEWQVKFQARVQQRDESLVEYIGELRMLASRAFPGWSEEQCDVLIRNQFIQGVSSSSIQVQLLKEMPKSVKDAATLARRLETVEMAHRRLQTERIAERPLAVAAPVSATSLEDKLDKLSAQVKKLADEPATAEVGSIETSSATWARGLVEGRKTDMLLDTGSAVTILRAEVWNELKGVDSGTRELQVVSKSVVTADGSSLEMLGQVTLSVEIGGLVGLHPILVAKSLTQECILGADFLVAHGCVLDYTTKTLLAGGKLVPVHCKGQCVSPCYPVMCSAVLMEDTCIQEQCEMQVPVSLTLGEGLCAVAREEFCGLLEPEPLFMERHGLAVAHSISRNKNGVTIIQIMNPNPTAIRVLKGEKVGKFHSVDESKCVCVLSGSSPEVGSRSQESLESIITSLVCDAEDLSSEERKQLKELLHRFSDVISLSDSDIGRTEMIQHHINTENAKPVKQAPRRLPFHHLKEVKKLVESMLDNNVIEPSNGPWASPIVLVKKKDGSTRFCVDFRQLNSVTRKDAHPIPRIDETLDALHGACWFSTLDLASGYWQVKVAPEDREKTAFTTPYGLYQFCVMPFGLCNAPSTFQRLMELVLAGLHWSSCLVYLDDIIIYSRTVKEHLTRLEEVLERLQAAGMKLKPKKCRLLRRKVNYLGYIVSSGGVQTDPLKVESILSWPSPTTQKELRQFLGLASYYRRFVKGFASIAAPLNHLLEKGKPWEWTKVCEHAFSSLKKMLTTSPILAYPDFEIEFTVDCDASGDGLGAVLSQCIGGGENVISYASRSLTKPEKKYCATRKEMLALVWAVGQFRPYLLGRPFTVRTDHSALQWLYSFKEPEGQVARWLESLAEYEFTVQHRPGKKHTNADALSRVPCQDAPAVNANSIPLDRTDSWLSQLSKREIRELQSRDEGIEQVIEWVEHPKTQPQRCPPSASHVMKSLWAQKKYLEVIDGVLYRRWEDAGGGGLNKCFQLVIPPSLVPTVLAELHDSPTAGHLGVGKVLEKWTEAFAIPDMETVTVARVFVNEFVSRFGAPTHLHTDQGRSFESSLIKELCQLMGIVKTRTTPYHPQSDGMIERFNRTLLSMLRMAAVDDESNWDLKLPCLMLAYRTSVHEATKHTPFSLMFGREVQLPIDVMFGLPTGSGQPTNVPVYVKELRKWLSEAYERVRQHLSAEQKRHKLLYDTKVAGNPFVKGDKVWLHNAAVPRGYSKKLHRFWKGPYTVVDVLNNCVYKIKQDASPHKQHTVHFDRLKPYLHRVEHTEEAGPSQQGDVPARETIPPHDVNEEMYDLVVVPQNQAAQLAPADEETQQPVEHYHEDPVEEVGEQDDGDDTEPHQVEQVPLRRSSRSRQPPERLGSWTYF
eukprot:Em0004g1249a